MKISIKPLLQRLPDIYICFPVSEKVVIYGVGGEFIISNYVLKKIPYQVVHLPVDKHMGTVHLYISAAVVINMILNCKLVFRDIPPISFLRKIRLFVGNLIRVYQLSVIEAHNPKLVLSIQDTSYQFQWMSKYCKKVKFIAIANSPRTELNLNEQLPHRFPHPAATVCLQYLFVHGEIERDLFSRLGHKIDNFIVSGPVRSGYYRSEMAFSNPKKVFDICLISQYEPNVMEGGDTGDTPELKKALLALYLFIRKYVREYNLTFCIALRYGSQMEIDHFIEHFGPGIFMQAFSLPGMSTYFLIDACDIAVTFDSSAGREAFSWGKKTFFANYSGNPARNCISQGPWLLEGGGYEEFESALGSLREMNMNKYTEISQNVKTSMMRFDNMHPAHIVIREHILNLLG